MNLNKCSILLKLFGLTRCILIKAYYRNSLNSASLFFVGKNIKFYIKHGKIKLGKRVHLSDYVHLESSGYLEIGKYTTINSFSRIVALDRIIIGSHCAIASFVTILDHDHDFNFTNNQINYEGFIRKSIHIGSNVWIGDKVTIVKGVTIGDNVIVGANSMVNKDIPPNCVAGGSPCEVIRFLTNDK